MDRSLRLRVHARCRGRLVALVLLILASRSIADITLVGRAMIPGDARDHSGLSGTVGPDHTPRDQAGSFGSALAYSGTGNVYYALNDRGPRDGEVDFLCRFHEVTIDIDPRASVPIRVHLTKTVMLRNKLGLHFTGLASAFDGTTDRDALRLDPEGIRVGPHRTLFIADEYGPWIDEFSLDGQHIRRLAVPKKFRIEKPASTKPDELPPHNVSGRVSNKGFESLAISPDGMSLFAMPQSPLLQDGALDEQNKSVGTNLRLLALDLATGTSREYLYPLDSPELGCNELLAVDSTKFLAIERDGKGGKSARIKHIKLIDLANASEITAIERLPARDIPTHVRPIRKRVLIDLLDEKFNLRGEAMPEKVEGLTFGPKLPDGSHSLIVTCDNDFHADTPNVFWVFSVPGDAISF